MTFSDTSHPNEPLVLTIDVGSSSVRAIVFDHQTQKVEGLEAHQSYEFQTTADGGVEVSADMLLDLVVNTVDEVLHRAGELSAKIAAVAVSTFWHNLLGVGPQNQAVTPVYSWADTRSASA